MSKPYKLHKVNSLPSTATEGDIYFVKSDKKIYVRTASGWEDFNGVPVNNLTTTTTGKALDAAQGYALKQAINTGLNNKVDKNNVVSSWVKVVDNNPSNIDPLKMALSTNIAGCNRLAFLPADQIVIEKTTDGGVTWEDYGASDDTKEKMFLNGDGVHSLIKIPLKDGVKSADCAVRITITAMKFNVPENTPETEKVNYWTSEYVKSTERYFGGTGVFDIWLTCTLGTIKAKLETRAGSSTDWVKQKEVTNLIGWSGRNMFPFSLLFGGNISQVANIWCWRMTFSGDTGLDLNSTIAHTIHSIRYYSSSMWAAPNNLMKHNHIYTWNRSQDALFPAAVTATNFIEGGTTLISKYANKTYNAKSYEAINIKTDNSDASKAANVAAIKAYTDNLISLGVSLNNGFIIPVRVDSINYGVLVGSGSTPRLHGYINRDNTCNSLVIAVDGTAAMSQIQRAAESTLSTTSKTIVGAINELKIEAGMRDNDISAAQSQALSAQEEATDAKNKVTDLEKKIPTIDSALSDTSTNPVQNKILKTCLDNIADNVDAVADAVATLSNKETTIAGQKVKIGGEITAVQLTKGLRFPIRSVLNLLESDQSLSLSSFNAYLTENNLSLQDYFCAPTMIYRSEDDAEPKCGMMYNSPTSHCLTGIFDTGTDTVEFEDIQKIQFNTNSGTINIGNNGLAEVPSATINLSSVPTTSTPVTTTLNDYDYKQMTDLSIKKYVKFPNTMSVNNARTLMELTLMEKSEMIRLSGAEEVWTYVYQHICYYGGGIHVFEFSLNSDTKVLTAKMIM